MSHIKSLINNLINQRTDEATLDLHNHLKDAMRSTVAEAKVKQVDSAVTDEAMKALGDKLGKKFTPWEAEYEGHDDNELTLLGMGELLANVTFKGNFATNPVTFKSFSTYGSLDDDYSETEGKLDVTVDIHNAKVSDLNAIATAVKKAVREDERRIKQDRRDN